MQLFLIEHILKYLGESRNKSQKRTGGGDRVPDKSSEQTVSVGEAPHPESSRISRPEKSKLAMD